MWSLKGFKPRFTEVRHYLEKFYGNWVRVMRKVSPVPPVR